METFDEIYELAFHETKLVQHFLRNCEKEEKVELSVVLEKILVELDAISRTIFEKALRL